MNKITFNSFVFLLLIIAITSGLYGNSPLFFLSAISMIIIVMLRFWNNHIFSYLYINQSLSQTKAYSGQILYYQIQIENKKLLPVLFLKIRTKLTSGISFINKQFSQKSITGEEFQDMLSLGWYQRLLKSYQFTAVDRGIYYLGGTTVNNYGLLGLYTNYSKIDNKLELTIYPRILPLSFSRTIYSELFGSNMRKGWIYEDNLNRVGVRPYHHTDDFRKINWKSSARHIQLESNIYKPSLDKEIHLFLLNNISIRGLSEEEINKVELSIICAASLTDKYLKENYQVAFYTNYINKKGRRNKYEVIRARRNPRQKELILTTMARLGYISTEKPSKILEKERKGIKPGSTIVMITLDIDEEFKKIINYYNKFYQFIIIQLGNEKSHIPGVKIYYLDTEEDWHDIQNLSFIH